MDWYMRRLGPEDAAAFQALRLEGWRITLAPSRRAPTRRPGRA